MAARKRTIAPSPALLAPASPATSSGRATLSSKTVTGGTRARKGAATPSKARAKKAIHGGVEPPLRPLLQLGSDALEGLSPRDQSRARKLLNTMLKHAPEGRGSLPLLDAVDGLLSVHEFKRAPGLRAIMEALKIAASDLPAGHPIHPLAARSLALQASNDWFAKDPDGAWKLYTDAAEMLAHHPSSRARDVRSYALQQRVRMQVGGALGSSQFEGARGGVEELIEEVERAFHAYARNRALEATDVWVSEYEGEPGHDRALILRLTTRALALPRHEGNTHTWAFVVSLLGHQALAYRLSDRLTEARQSCLEVLPLLPRVSGEQGRESAAWALAEGAFLCADLLEQPDDAVPFLRALRGLLARPRGEAEASELAYGMAMEARCALLQGQLDPAAQALDELDTFAKRWPGSSGVLTAVVSGQVLRGDLLRAQGRMLEAHEVWRAVARGYAEDPEQGRRTEAEKARKRMAQG